MSKGGESIVFVIMFVVIAGIKLVKAFMDQQGGSGKSSSWDSSDDGWEDWETERQPSPSRPARPAPPPPPPRPVLTSAPRHGGAPQPTGRTLSPALQEVIKERAEAKLRQMAARNKAAQKPPPEPPPMPVHRLVNPATDAMEKSLATAFPAAQKMTRGIGARTRAPIRLNGVGRRNLRRGLLMSEVLGPPRAFDV